METFVIKLAVAVSPLIALIAAANLPSPRLRRRAQVILRGRRTRHAIARALAMGIMFR
jgi:uncharacterized protein (DUF2062 family)